MAIAKISEINDTLDKIYTTLCAKPKECCINLI